MQQPSNHDLSDPDDPFDDLAEAYLQSLRQGADPALEPWAEAHPEHADQIRDLFPALAMVEAFKPHSVELEGAHSEPRSGLLELAEGRRIGAYLLERELGRGGQGTVWLARDTRLQRPVALKILSAGVSLLGKARRRFEREADIVSRLDHPGICTIYEVGEVDQVPFLAMQYVAGETLAERIRAVHQDQGAKRSSSDSSDSLTSGLTTNRRELEETLQLFEKVARALDVAHEAHVVHRDIKPGNLMVHRDGEPIVLDFGLASAESEDQETLTRTGDVFGTPAYMSPEQISGDGAALDRRTDVYSLGASLFEALTLERPFRAATRHALYQEILTRDVPDARKLNKQIPPELQIVLETALDKDPERRYATALSFAEELQRVRTFQPIVARPMGWFLRLRRFAQRNPAVALVTFLLFASISTAALLLFQKNLDVLDESRAKGRALQEARDALAERDEAIADQASALADYASMADVKRLAEAKKRANQLYPAHPRTVPAMEAWLMEYEPMFQRIPEHRERLRELERKHALPYTDEDRLQDHPNAFPRLMALRARKASMDPMDPDLAAVREEIAGLEERTSQRKTWRFPEEDQEYVHDTLSGLIRGLEAATGPRGVRAHIRSRARVAAGIEEKTVTEHAALWKRVIEDIASSEHYGGLRIRPQVGLVPLGLDPRSGLHEFVDWTTHERGSPLPERNSKGVLEPQAEWGFILVLIPGGTFTMGAQRRDEEEENYDPDCSSGDEGPVHSVTLEPYFLSKYEMTQAIYKRLRGGRNPSAYRPSNAPGVSDVSPMDTLSYDLVTVMLPQLGFALPTEAQWEYACRAGSITPYATASGTASDLTRHANIADEGSRVQRGPEWVFEEGASDGYPVHAPIGSFAPNAFGLHDMHGNMFEWCRDYHAPYISGIPREGDGYREVVPKNDLTRVLRGGSFDRTARHARSSARTPANKWEQRPMIGVRPAKRLERDH